MSDAGKGKADTALDWLGRRGLLLALVLGAVLRVGWLLLCPNEPSSDQTIYHRGAADIARGLGFVDEGGRPHGWWPVGYPAALSPFYYVLGDSPRSSHVANVVFGLALIAAAYALCRELFDRRAAAVAALLVAVYPTFVLLTTVTASEMLFMPLSVLGCFLLVRAVKRPEHALAYCAAGGLVIGLSAYVRAPGLLLAIVFPAYALLQQQRLARTAPFSAVVGAVAIAALVPWGFRTQRSFGTFQLVSMNGGSNLWMGNHEGGDGGYAEPPRELAGLPIPAFDARMREMALAFIREDPVRYAKLCVSRTIKTLRSDTIGAVWNKRGIEQRFGSRALGPLKALCTAGYFAGLGLLAFALVRRRKRLGGADLTLLAIIAATAFPFVFIVGGNRYHVPIAPYVLIWAASAFMLRRSRPESDPATG